MELQPWVKTEQKRNQKRTEVQSEVEILHLFFVEESKRGYQHSEAFPIFLSDMFMMDFVRSSNAFCIPIVRIAKKLEALVDKDVMYHKIGNTISENTKSNR